MQNKFKRHQQVIMLRIPGEDFIEHWTDPPAPLKPGMKGKVNVILPNGMYHVEIHDDKGEVIAYVAVDEDGLEAV